MAAALGWITASQLDQLLLDVPLDLDPVRPGWLGPGAEGRLDTLGDEPLADTGDGPGAGAQGGDDLVVGVLPAGRGVGPQEDAGWVSLRAAALPAATRRSNSPRSSEVRLTRYLSIAELRSLRPMPLPESQETASRITCQSKIDGPLAERKGQLEVRRWEDAQLRDGHFDQNRMLALIEEVLTGGKVQGFPLTRLVANMEWALEDRPGVDDIVEYETRLNYVLPKYDDAVC